VRASAQVFTHRQRLGALNVFLFILGTKFTKCVQNACELWLPDFPFTDSQTGAGRRVCQFLSSSLSSP
jgi:hypothetical protein